MPVLHALAAATLLAAAAAAPPTPVFIDRAAEAGLVFRYENGRTGKYYFPEIMGGGVALFDYDGDGDLDVFVVQGRPLAAGTTATGAAALGGRLFRNDLSLGPDGRMVPYFVDVTATSGIRDLGYGIGVATGDVDNDGNVDLYVLHYGGDQLWHNAGDGTFKESTLPPEAGGARGPRWGAAATFADLDRDGWLDLYVARYVDFTVAGNVSCFAASSRRDYCHPSAYPPAIDRLLRNRRDGSFADVSLPSGITAKAGRGLGVVADDLDGDGWPDLLVANDGMPNFLWRNRHDFTFEEAALPAGVAVDAFGRAQANMGIAIGDFDDDGDDDLFISHLAGETSTLFVADGHGNFEDRTTATGLAAATVPFTGFGAGWLDFDADGRLDLLIANGAVTLLEDQAAHGNAYPYAQTPQLLRQMDGKRFVDVSATAGPLFSEALVGRGVAFGDIDNDGGMDALIVDGAGPLRLLMNQVGGPTGAWFGLRLLGSPPGARGRRDLLGARVAVHRRGAATLWRRAATDGSYASASDPRVLVGLGAARDVSGLEVLWPDGRREYFPPPRLGAYTDLVHGTGTPRKEGSP